MKIFYWLVALACILPFNILAESRSVNGVQIEGNRRIDSAAINAQLKHQRGVVSDSDISEEVKALYKTGFFNQVTASVVSEGGKTFVKYTLVEKPVVRKVFIQGNKGVDEADLKDIFKFGTERFLDRSKIFFLIKNAISYYQAKGYYDAAFDYSVVPVGENQVDLVLTVQEGVRYRIRDIEFRGTKEIDEDDLSEAMQTKTHKWWSSWLLGTGRLNRDMLENDRQLIRQYFLDNGYIDASISDPKIEAKDGSIRIFFDVEEGRQYKIGGLSVSGDDLGPDVNLLDGISSEVGETFSASQIREDAFKISDKFTDIGFAFANVVPDTRINRELATLDVDFAVSKGKTVTVDRIGIKGNNKTYDNVIRRELKIAEQEPFSSSKVKRSQLLLERTGFFEEANIATEPTSQEDQVNLLVNVKEGSTGTFSAGAGLSSADGLLFNTRVSENNIFGTGRSASINLDIGTERDNASINFSDRRINDSFWSGSVTALRSYREYSDFDRVLMGGSLALGYPMEELLGEFWEDVDFSVEYEFLDVDIKEVDPRDAAELVIQSEGRSTSSAITPKLVRNTINNPLDPKSGSRQQVSFETASLGGTESYFLFEARNQWYYPLFELGEAGPLVFSWRITFGYGETYDDDPFPLFKRFFPGGINSVRGYKTRSLGPKDTRGNEYGGSSELVNNLELIFPLVRSAGLKGVIFYDAGEAFDDGETVDIGELRLAYGYGIRWSSPLGPIRIEFGIPIDREEGESNLVTMFSFGAPI